MCAEACSRRKSNNKTQLSIPIDSLGQQQFVITGTMANIQELLTCYTRLGFTPATVVSIVDNQRIESAAELGFLKDGEIEALCKAVKRPCGTVANPYASNAGQPDRIPNPRNSVSLRAEKNMKLASYFLQH